MNVITTTLYTLIFPIIYFTTATPKVGVVLELPYTKATQYLECNSISIFAIDWGIVEGDQGEYDWSYYDDQIAELSCIQRDIIVKNAPVWAREYPEYGNSPPKREYWDSYANFVVAVTTRYRPAHIQIWNEPEIKLKKSGLFGGWGIDRGMDYALFALNVQQKVHDLNLPVMIVTGGFSSLNSYFVADVSSMGNFDAISWHYYPYFPLQQVFFDGFIDSINIAKTKFPNADRFVTETALLCYGICDDSFYEQQAIWLSFISQQDISGVRWYTLGWNDWMRSDMLSGGIDAPVYRLYLSLYP